jgi:pantoate--beta-alanine ligase
VRTISTAADVALLVSRAKIAGKKVAFVPTMGAIHEGHLSLVRLAKEKADLVVVSIFVNPLQFGKEEDFETYPRTELEDAKLLSKAGTDVLFTPSVQEVYPNSQLSVTESAGPVGAMYEGDARPGHFDGMLTVVSRLFDIVQPDTVIFGAKDAQQLYLIRQMVKRQNPQGNRDPIEVIEAPTIRDGKGLALSSRNKRLSKVEMNAALTLSKALSAASTAASQGAKPSVSYFAASSVFSSSPEAKLDYLALVDPETFEKIPDGFTGQALMIVAANVGNVRLIDNRLITF